MADYVDKEEMVNIMAKCNECKAVSRKINSDCEKVIFYFIIIFINL